MGLSPLAAEVPAGAGRGEVVADKAMLTGAQLYRFDVKVRHAAPGISR